MSLFDGIRNLFDDDEDEKKKQTEVTSDSWFAPQLHPDYNENKDLYDQANYYWTTGEFPVVEYDEEEKKPYSQDYNNPWALNYSYSADSPLYYTKYREEAAQLNKEKVEAESKNKRGTLDRIFGLISNNSLVQGAYYALDDDKDTTFLQGLGEGISFMNPFKDDVSNRKSFSDVIELLEKDSNPNDDKFGENVVEGLLGFAGDVLLDPLTYVTGGFSAIGKIAKGSGAAVKGVKYVDAAGNIIENADDITNLGKVLKTASDNVESAKNVAEASAKVAQNFHKNLEGTQGVIKVLDAETAKRIIKEYDTVRRYTADEIDNMASEVTKSFNKTFFGLSEGGQDLTFFGQKIADANYFRNLGDKTIAPYYNKLANKIRQSKIASKFGVDPHTKSAITDFNDAFMPYFNQYISKKNKSHIAKVAKEAQDFVQDEINKFSKEEQDLALYYMDEGIFATAKQYHENKLSLYKKAIKDAQNSSPEYIKIKSKLEEQQELCNHLNDLEEYIRTKVGTVDMTIIKQAQARRDGLPYKFKDELLERKEEIETLFGKSIDDLDKSELNKVKELFDFEYNPDFGVYGTHSAISSTEKPLEQILYDYLIDDSVFNISKSADVSKVMEKFFGDIDTNTAKKALTKETLRKLKSVKSFPYTSFEGFSSLKNRYNAFNVLERTMNNKYILSTYGSDLTKIRDALIEKNNEFDKYYELLSNENLIANPAAYKKVFNLVLRQQNEFFNPSNILKIVKENTSDPVLIEDLNTLLLGFEDIYKSGNLTSGAVKDIVNSLKKHIDTGVAKNSFKSKSVDNVLKSNVIRNLSIDDRLTLAKNIKETNQRNFYKHLDSLSNEEIYNKYFSATSNATDKTKSLVFDYQCKKATVYTDTGARVDFSKLDEGTLNYIDDRIKQAQVYLNDSMRTRQKELEDFDIYFTQVEDAIVDSYMKNNFGLTDELLSVVKSLDPESELYKFMEKFQNKMSDIASDEYMLGVLSEGQALSHKDSYVLHKFTPEAQREFATNPELKDRLGYYAEGVSTTKRSNKTRRFKTIREAEEFLQKEFPEFEGKFFETDLAELWCARCIDSDRLIGQKENMKYIFDNLSFPYEGKGSLTSSRELVVNYEELTQALMERQGVKMHHIGDEFKTIDYEVLREFDIDPDYVTSNNPLIRISEEGYEKLNEYLDAGLTDLEELAGTRSLSKRTVSGYTFEPNVIDAINHNSLRQNNLTESAFWQLYDKFLSTYKMVNTIYSPSFYGNNAVGNAFNSFLYSGAAAFDPKKLKIARGIASTGDPNQFLTLHGEKYSYKQLRDICGRLGISNTSFYEHEIRQDAKGFANMKLNKKLLEISSGIEDTQRIALFVEALDNTGDFDKAVDVVNKFLFDYSDLTDFEHKVMKRAIPFYTFMRKNAPLQLEQIMCNPRVYRNLNYGFNNFETLSGENYVEPYERNKWREDYVQLPFQINGENAGFNMNLPYEQLDRLTPNKIIGQTSPFIKAVPELMSGKYAFTGMDINGLGEYIGNQVSPFRITNTLVNKDTNLDKVLYGLSQSGINFATVDNQLANQQDLIEQYYPYVNSDNVGFDEESMLAALIDKIRSDKDE